MKKIPAVIVATEKKKRLKRGARIGLVYDFLKENKVGIITTEQIWEKFKKEHPEINHWHWNRITTQFFNPIEKKVVKEKEQLVLV